LEIDLTAFPAGGALLGVRVQPGAKKSGITGLWNGRVRVAVRAPPADGRANAELLEVLGDALGLRAASLELVRGGRSRLKSVHLPLEPAEARRRLLALLA
jgi:uncharacterized protein (TIGR00251 family)